MLLLPGRHRGLAYLAGPMDRRGADPTRLAARLGALVVSELAGRARLDPETPLPVRVQSYRLTRTLRTDLYVVWAQVALAVEEPLASSEPALLAAQAYRDAGAGREVDAHALAAEMDRPADGRDRRTMAWGALAAGAPAPALAPIAEEGFALLAEGSYAPPAGGRDGGGAGGGDLPWLVRLLTRRVTPGEAIGLLTGTAALAGAVVVARRRGTH